MAELHISTGIDTSPLVNGLNDIRSELKKTAKAIDELSGKFDKLPNAEEKTEGLASANKKLSEAAMQCADEIAKLREEHDRATMSIDEAQKELEEEERIMKKYGVTASEVTEALQKRGDVEEKGTSSTSKSSKATKDASVSNKEAAASINEMASAASSLPGPVGQAASSVASLTSMVSKLMSSGWLWFLGAVAAAYEYLTWSMSRTVEGQEQLDLVTSKYKQRLENLKDAASAAGRSLFSAFDHAAGAVERFLGKVDSVFESLSKLGGGAVGDVLSFIGGKVGIVSKMSRAALGWVWNRNTDEAASLQGRENNQWQKKNKFIVEEARLQKEINEERAKAYDYSLKESERAAAIKKATELTNKLYDQKVAIAREDAEIAKERAKLSDTDKATADAVQKAEAEALNIESQRANQLRFLKRMEGRFNKPDKSGASAAAEMKKELQQADALFQQQLEQLERQEKELQDRKNAEEDARIAAIENDGERERAEEKHQHELRLQQIKQQADAMRKANYEAAKKAYEAVNGANTYSQTAEGKKGWSGTALTADQLATINAQISAENAAYSRLLRDRTEEAKQAAREAKNELLRQFGDYAQQKQALIDTANQKIYNLQKTLTDQSTDDEREAVRARVEIIKKELLGDLEQLDLKYGATKPFFADLFEEEADRSVASINKILKKYEALVSFLKGEGKVSSDDLKQDFGFTDAEISNAIERVRQEGVAGIDGFIDALKQLTEKAKEGVKKIKEELSTFLDASSDLFGKFYDRTKEEGGSTQDVRILGSVSAGAGAISSLLKGDFNGMVSAIERLEDAFNYEADNHEEMVEHEEMLQTHIDSNTYAIEKNTETLNKVNGIEAVNASKELVKELSQNLNSILAGIIAVSNDSGITDNRYGSSLAEYLDSTGARVWDRWIQNLANRYGLDAYDPDAERSYRERGKSTHSVSYGGYTWSALLNNNSPEELAKMFKDLRENNTDLWNDILQVSREYTDKELEEWIDKLVSTYEQIEEAEESLYENLTTVSADQAFSDFLNSLYDLADGSEDVFDDISSNWQKMVNRMVINNLIGAELKGELEEWYDSLGKLNKQHVEGTITDEEYREGLEALKQSYEDLVTKGKDKIQDFTEMGIIKPIEEATEAVNEFEDAINSLISSLSDTSTLEEWGRSFKENIIAQFMEGFLTEEDKSHIQDAMQAIADIMNDVSLTPEEKASRAQPFIEAIEKYVAGGKEATQQLRDAFGLTDETEEELAKPFENLKDDILDSLTDLEKGAENFKKSMQSKMISDVIEKMVLGNKVQIQNADGSLAAFDTFNDWLEDWQQRYSDVLNDATLADEERERRLQALVDEAVEVREAEAESAQQFAEKLKKVEEAVSDTTFKDMDDSFVSALMDMDKDADAWGEEIGRTMARRIIEQFLVAKQIQPLLDTLQTAMDSAFTEKGGGISTVLGDQSVQAALAAIKDRYPELQETVRQIMKALGLDVSKTVNSESDNPFSSLGDSLVSSLMDMDSTAESFGKQIGQTLAEQMIRKIVNNDKNKAKIDAVAQELQEAIASGDAREIEEAQRKLEELYAAIEKNVHAIRDTQKVIEELNDTTFTGMRDSFRSAIMDMSADGKDFARDITKIITEQLVDRLILGDDFDKYIDGVQKQYNTIMHDDSLTAEQKAAQIALLGQGVTQMAAELQEATKGIFDATGWSEKIEQLNTPLADMRSKFLSTLSDMKSDAGDFAKDITDIMVQDFIDKFVLGDAFDQQLEHWQDQYSKIMSSDVSEEERAKQLKQLQQSISSARDAYAETARGIHELMGTAEYGDQSATMNMSDKATYEQMDQYLGTNMGILMATEQGNQVRQQILATLQTMGSLTSPDNPVILEMRGLMAIGNEYLLDIKRSNREILENFGARLSSIDGKLSRL